ncbi:hypothetical protein [Tatumella sp. UCD-D_suzukii]|uniref:hypothetical protein n=1 Tax=Tatumella sp. UCD-D_suzukii TaxID=1408192 RepID=UPI00128ED454|nr:hypothetical protein [Tatumella sp. UCD-D_suzukii]
MVKKVLPPQKKKQDKMKKQIQDLHRVSKVWATFRDESELGIVLISTSLIETALTEVLRACMVNDAEITSIKGGKMYARVDLAYGFGLISKEEKECILLINQIRNNFAHSWTEATFDNNEIFLKIQKIPCRNFSPEDMAIYHEFSAKEKFMQQAMMIIMDLLSREVVAHESKLRPIQHMQSSWSKTITPSAPKRKWFLP